MDITNSLSILAPGEVHLAAHDLCSIERLVQDPQDDSRFVQIDKDHLPAPLRRKEEEFQRKAYKLLTELWNLQAEMKPSIEHEQAKWAAGAYYSTAKDLLSDQECMNYMPVVINGDKPFTEENYAEVAEERPEAGQRLLATEILSENLSKDKLLAYQRRARKFVTALDPIEDKFFSEELVQQCLVAEGLDSDIKINQLFGRKEYTPVRKRERREALQKVWFERRDKILLSNIHGTLTPNVWEDNGIALDSCRAFTNLAISTVLRSDVAGRGAVTKQFQDAFWSVLKEGTELGDEEEYLLDPRYPDWSFEGLKRLSDAFEDLDWADLYEDTSMGGTAAQDWFRTVGLPALYGQSVDWWEDFPPVIKGPYDDEDTLNILSKPTPSAYERLCLFRNEFKNTVREKDVIASSTMKLFQVPLEQVLL